MMLIVMCGGSVVNSVPCVRKVAGSNQTLAAAYGPWASCSLVVACSASGVINSDTDAMLQSGAPRSSSRLDEVL